MKKISLLTLLCALLLTPLSYAHFHYEINSQATLIANEKQQLSSVKLSWIYSPEVSEIMLKAGQPMEALSKSVFNDLAALNYFTRLTLNGKNIPTSKVTEHQLISIKQNNMNLLKLNFTLPLAAPLYIQGNNTLGIDHKDPSASATLFFRHTDNILLGNFAEKCHATVTQKTEFNEGETPEVVTISCKAK